MCGIAGVFHFPESPGAVTEAVPAMLQRLVPRGPDDSGIWRCPELELGHRRLAILDLSPAGNQPMQSADGRWVISFNGEIYNHVDLAREVGIARTNLRSRTDTEILLEAWARRGAAVLPRAVGQFAIALYDRTEHRLWLVRDRFGEKPLYYHHGAGRLTFASSIAALLAAPWIPKALDPDALVEFATLRYVVSPRTVLQGIRKVRPGHLLCIDRDGVSMRQWYSLPFSGKRYGRIRRADVEQLDHLLRQATRRCLVSDVPVALFLSDGIDSHSIAATGGGALPSFSYVAHEGSVSVDDVGPGHTMVEVSNEERMNDLDQAFASLTEPVGDGVALATWQLVKRARSRATVFLCGHGGDEIAGGYRLNRDLLSLRGLHALRWFPSGFLRGLFPRSLNGLEPFAERMRRIRAATSTSMPAAVRYLIHRPLPLTDLQGLFQRPVEVDACLSSVDRIYEEVGASGGDLDRIQAVMTQTFLTENLCSFCDSAGMASSAEIRMPFLDRDLVEFLMSRPASDRALASPRRDATKRILRRWARDRVPPEVQRRRKRSFESGRIGHLLAQDPSGVRSRILDVAELRTAMPGLEAWLTRTTTTCWGAQEGTYWALLAMAVWWTAL